MNMRWINWVDKNIENVLIFVFYAFFCSIIFGEVIIRYGFANSTGWGEMTARYAFIFVATLAIANGARARTHIRIDLVPAWLSGIRRLVLYIYLDTLQLLLATLVIVYSIQAMNLQWTTGHLMESLDLNMAFAYVALPIGWSLFVLRLLRRTFADIKGFRMTGRVELNGGMMET